MTENELPEDLAPAERHWALSPAFIIASITPFLSAGVLFWVATR